MKCKVATWWLPVSSRTPLAEIAFPLHFSVLAARLTRSRKVAAEDAFCCDFSAQTNRLHLTARSYFRDAAKNEGGKVAAENFVGSNDQQ